MQETISTEYVYREHRVVVEYSSIDDLFVIKIENMTEKGYGYTDATSVDELKEAVDDMIDTMTEDWDVIEPDHESEVIDEIETPSDEEIEEIRAHLNEIADYVEENNTSYFEHRGYKALVEYLPKEDVLRATFENADIEPVYARSLKSLYHHFQLDLGTYMKNRMSDLPDINL